MKTTRTDWPRPRDPREHEPVEIYYFSVFPDVTVTEGDDGGER